MTRSAQPRPKPLRVSDVEDRGRALQHRFRVAGFPQYTRWLVEHEPKWMGDGSLIARVRSLFNGRGSMGDVELLEKCEALADRFLDNTNRPAAA